ncbi:hypothetical protein COB47_1678 [Caldicellulosiruptor obsidiansis OB47]|uniref:Uncharacterized protein n=1 Tax=Caldicellulosiruptor obsidiansis (strain ATCC BAA-2073 / JCM 16842 / OB47) TaxID=608506 RepID=D9TFI8_CALOO|nr:hypothetical protein [Caldicellulosiruptor obsidiansis]ADL42958.1 hypothetical protein COB47_1678 [Caldicellulosiruptor obsidiansis OB47]
MLEKISCLKDRMFIKKVDGSVLIVVIIVIAVLSTILLGTMSAVLASLNQSTSIYQKSATGYGAESAAEEFLYYFNQLLEDAKNIAYGYYYKGDGTLKDICPGRVRWLLGDESYEPGKILDDLRHGRISRDVAEDKVYEGMKAIIRDEVSRFMNDVGSDASIKVESLSLPEFKKLSDLVELYIKPHYESLTGYELDDITVNAWSGTTSGSLPDGYTIYIDVSKKRAGTSSDKEVKRALRLDVRIADDSGSSVNLILNPSPTPVPSSPLDYAIFSKGALNTNKNLTVENGSVYSGGDLTIHGGAVFNIDNLISKGEMMINQDSDSRCRDNNIVVRNIIYVEKSLKANRISPRSTNIDAKTIYVGQEMQLYGAGSYKFVQLFSDSNVKLAGPGVNMEVSALASIRGTLEVIDGATVTLKSNSAVYCNSLVVRNGSRLILENGAKLYVATTPDASTIISIQNNGGTISYSSSFSYPPTPAEIDEIRNRDYTSGLLITPLPADSVGSPQLGSTADITQTPPQIVIYGESFINDNEARLEILGRLSLPTVDFSTLQLHLISRGNITFVGGGMTILNGSIISLGNALDVNCLENPYAGLTLKYQTPSPSIQQDIENNTGIQPSQIIYTEADAVGRKTLYNILRRNIVIK